MALENFSASSVLFMKTVIIFWLLFTFTLSAVPSQLTQFGEKYSLFSKYLIIWCINFKFHGKPLTSDGVQPQFCPMQNYSESL